MPKNIPETLRPAWIEVDLDAVAHNTRIVKKFLGDTKLLVVVKADAYGLGAVNTTPTILANGADKLGVAIIDEGIELRNAGITAPIFNMAGILPKHAELVADNNLEQAVNSTEVALALSDVAVSRGEELIVHLKIDTGMSRWGVRFNRAVEWITEITKLPNLVCESVFTHFPKSDVLDASFAELQMHRFRDIRRQVELNGISIPIWHMANSGGTLNLVAAHFEMVRVGLLVYGYFPSKEVPQPFSLKPAMSLKAKIIQIKLLQPGDTVGYGRRYTAQGEERIGVLQIGYSDGYDRRLLNCGEVLINGGRAPIIGGLCMDACFVGLVNLPDASVGDTVTLMGRDGEDDISPHEIADKTGTVSYDDISNFTKRLPRVYFENGEAVAYRSLTTGMLGERL